MKSQQDILVELLESWIPMESESSRKNTELFRKLLSECGERCIVIDCIRSNNQIADICIADDKSYFLDINNLWEPVLVEFSVSFDDTIDELLNIFDVRTKLPLSHPIVEKLKIRLDMMLL